MPTSNIKTRFYREVEVGGFSRVDGSIDFYTRVNSLIRPEMTVVDFGAGRGQFLEDDVAYRRDLRNLRGKVAKVVGVDPDPVVIGNEAVDEAIVMPDHLTIPLPDKSVDLVVSDHTFEHVVDPQAATAELARVLRPGGWICARTPNKHGYIGVGARAVPNSKHTRLLRRLQPHRQEQDVFPVAYRLNTRRDVRTWFPASRFDVTMYTVTSEPAYFGESRLAWRVMSVVNAHTPQAVGAKWMIFIQKR